ncbi:hypothetical protein, partial [Sinorhizobium meliloti]|uniref:hypothetical protein n=1 Tax=Rhizobium meliloti TaxID=382 RepID=UPI001AF01789
MSGGAGQVNGAGGASAYQSPISDASVEQLAANPSRLNRKSIRRATPDNSIPRETASNDRAPRALADYKITPHSAEFNQVGGSRNRSQTQERLDGFEQKLAGYQGEASQKN